VKKKIVKCLSEIGENREKERDRKKDVRKKNYVF